MGRVILFLVLSLSLLASVALSCPNELSAGKHTLTLNHDGRTRTYSLYVPSGLGPTTSVPLLFNFHGYTSSGDAQEAYTSMDSVAERERWLAVHAEGVQNSWNAGACCGVAQYTRIDDVGFVRAMVEDIASRMCVNRNAVFSTGMSNGGFLSNRLACEAADVFTAVAPVSGVLGIGGDFRVCNPSRPVPLVHFHGTDDTLVPYDGNSMFPSVNATINSWLDANGCQGVSEITLRTQSTLCQRWSQCRGTLVTVELCTVEGLGHVWPGSTGVRQPPGTVNATDYMVENLFRRFAQIANLKP